MKSVLHSTQFLLLSIIAILLANPVAAQLRQPQQQQRPNFIIIQPDDFEFLASWNPPPHFDSTGAFDLHPSLIPHLTRLRSNGLVFHRAYAASPMCGTSRYSTLTGRYPSRSAYSRRDNSGVSVGRVVIPTTKLVDVPTVPDGYDCSRSNLAVLLRAQGYRTGVTGKWHLGTGNLVSNPYRVQQENIRACGFDTAEAVYWENLFAADGAFGHNLEHVTEEAIRFMNSAVGQGRNFFLYFNPTAPHTSGSVYEALTQSTCRDTPGGRLQQEPWVRGMTAGMGCAAYRQSILDRARGDTSNRVLGSIWVDDAVGALVSHLESMGQLENTFILFQLDHGKEGKASLYEPGIRIAQFAHYPNAFRPGSSYNGLVSTIDVAPTLAAYAGIRTASPAWYPMDGRSWKSAVEQGNTALYDRCLVAEMDQDRAVICRCDKSLTIGDSSNSRTSQRSQNMGLAAPGTFNLCDEQGFYRRSPQISSEYSTTGLALQRLDALQRCHTSITQPDALPSYGNCLRIEGQAPVATWSGGVGGVARPVFQMMANSLRGLYDAIEKIVHGR